MKEKRHVSAVQAASRKDRKQVSFLLLHNNLVQPAKEFSMQLCVKNKKK
jgi:hypothetical protein